MVAWLKRVMRLFALKRSSRRETSPETICKLAYELRELAQMAERATVTIDTPSETFRTIQQETGQLIELTAKAEFKHLPKERRLELHTSLMNSRKHLLETMAESAETTVLQ